MDTTPAEMTVTRMYKALSEGDDNAYMDQILPENRKVLNPVNLLKGLSIGGGVGPVSMGIDLGKLGATTVRSLKLEGQALTPQYVLVTARGLVRYPVLGLEVQFCDMHDVRLKNGSWYVDVYAPERQQRLDRVTARNQQRMTSGQVAQPTAPANDPLLGLFSGLGEGLEQALDLCD